MNYTKLVFIFILLTNTAYGQWYQEWETVFDEQFYNNSNNWTISNTAKRTANISGGTLIDEYHDKGYQIVNTIPVTFDSNEDYLLQFSISNINWGFRKKWKNIFPQYGFVWNFKDWSNYSSIIFQQGYDDYGTLRTYYKIARKVSGNEFIDIDWTYGYYASINTESSFEGITIEKTGNKVYIWDGINENTNSNIMLGPSSGSGVWQNKECGILIGGDGAKVALDYLIIKQKKKKEVIPITKKLKKTAWSGSGLIISNNGYIVTNYHVIENGKHIEVDVFNKGLKRTYIASVIGKDISNDLAVLKIENLNLKGNIPYGVKPYGVKVGEDIFAMGYPQIGVQGNEVKVTDGIISSKTGYKNNPTLYQISAPIQPGNSGGPLFDMNGNLIGITNAGIEKSDNVGYAIKTSYLYNLLDSFSTTIELSSKSELSGKSLPYMVEKLSQYTVLIRVNGVQK